MALMTRPWFRPRRVGIGWTPASWQGWLLTLALAAGVIGVLAGLRGSSARVPVAIAIVAVYAIVALATGGAQLSRRR
jgi:hypothetical protein